MNFKNFYLDGIEAAKKLESAQKEIKDVFEQLNKDIKDVTNGKIDILITREYDSVSSILNSSLMITDVLNQTDSKSKFISGQIIVTGKPYSEKIAKFKTSDEGGYPCKITYRNNDASAYDKESLIGILGGLISSPSVAIIFKKLLEKSD